MATLLPKVTQLSPRVIRVLGCNPGQMTLQGTNSYIIGTGKRRVLLDTTEPDIPEYTSLLSQVLQERGIGIEQIVLTHYHRDHVGGLPHLFTQMKLECPILKIKRKSMENESPPGDIGLKYEYINDGTAINTEGASMKVLYTPGHSDDHLSLLLEEENAIFTGDCILGEGTSIFDDLGNYIKSLKKYLEFQPSLMYPGHGPVITDPVNKVNEYITHRQEREDQILKIMEEKHPNPITIPDIINKLYSNLSENLQKMAVYIMHQHFKKLTDDGVIEFTEPDQYTLKVSTKVSNL